MLFYVFPGLASGSDVMALGEVADFQHKCSFEKLVEFICHFKEKQIVDLLQIITVTHAILTKDVGEIPHF
jgi:hypothetical protein